MSLGYGDTATVSYFYFSCSHDSIWKQHSYFISTKTASFHVLRVILWYLSFPWTSVLQLKKKKKGERVVACCIRYAQLPIRLANVKAAPGTDC